MVCGCSLLLAALPGAAFERERYEEPGDHSVAVLLNPEDSIYGLSLGQGTWLTGTPVFGDYFMRIFSNGIEDAWYSGLGMTLRIMPRWRMAPFAGVGGSYNYSLSQPQPTVGEREWEDQGRSYWGGHAEVGIRITLDHPIGLLELFGRHTWTSFSESDRDYWLLGLSTGTGY